MRTKEIIDPKRNIGLKASAGSGKTFALSLRVVNLLLRGVDAGHILCLTFTNKATNEMYQRIISLIRYLAFELNPSNIRDEANYLLTAGKEDDTIPGLFNHSFSDAEIGELRGRAGQVYEKVVRNISMLRISTIDSFLNSILRLFPFEAGVTPDFRILTSQFSERLYLDAFEHFVLSLERDSVLREMVADLIKKSYKAVNSPGTFLAPYFARLLEMRVGAERVIGKMLTCVEEGEGEQCMTDISTDLKLAGKMDISIRVESRAFARLLGELCPGISPPGLSELNKYESYSAGDIAGLTSLTRDSYDEYTYFRKCGRDRKAQALFGKIKRDLPVFIRLKNRVYRDAILYLFSLFTAYLDRVKKEKKGLAFSDVTNTCYRLLVGRGMLEQSPEYFYFRLDSRVDHLLIDEFQDTNFIQWLILKPFVDELTSGIGQKDRQGSFFFVGDPKQSIYRFRGGESRLFDKVLEQYRGKIVPETLGTNYRSSRQVVEFVNTLFSGIGARYHFAYDPQECSREESGGIVEVLFFTKDETKEDPDLKKSKVLEWLSGLMGRGIGPGDAAVLCSDNKECEEYDEFLILNGIPAVTEGSLSFLSSPAVDAVMEILRYLHDPRQNVYLLNFLFSVPGLVTLKEKRALLSAGDGQVLPDDIREKVAGILNRLNLLPVATLIRMIVDEFGLFSGFGGDANIILLMDMASSTELEDPLSLGVFLDFVETSLSDVKAVQEESINAVKVLTIHKAKGLEFPYVIVPELEIDMSVNANNTQLIFEYDEDLFTKNIHLNESEKSLRFHEELARAVEREKELVLRDRLNQLYVAMTRAREGILVVAIASEREEKKGKEPVMKLSDILFEVLGGEGYRAGEIVPSPALSRRSRKEGQPVTTSAGEVLSFIEERREEVYPAEERDETFGTRSFENFRARRLGVAFHEAVRSLTAFGEKDIGKAVGRVKAMFGSELSDGEIASIVARLWRLAGDSLFAELTAGMKMYHEVTLVKGKKISVPDMVLAGNQRITIIDFKTSAENELLERYRKQVEGYCILASQIYRTPCRGYLCFVLEDEVRYEEVSR